MAETQEKINGKFNWQIPAIVPSFAEGEDAEALYNIVKKTIENGVWYNSDSKTMKGSHTFLVARIDTIIRSLGIRVATLADLNRPEVREMIRDRHYSDTSAIVFRTIEDDYKPNELLIKKLIPLVEEKLGKLTLPVKITGFDVACSEDRNGYGFDIIPRDDFAVLHDERLEGKYNGKTFSTADKIGLPNFEAGGDRTWYARAQGLSRLYLNGNLYLVSGNGNLAYSSESGRVVLIRGEAATRPRSK